jgi:hypothetical protein
VVKLTASLVAQILKQGQLGITIFATEIIRSQPMGNRQYRGKTKDGKWVEGWYVESSGINFIIPDDSWDYYDEEEGQRAIYGAIEVIPSTVGQATGREDKHKKLIYEGDIIKGMHDFGPGGWVERGLISWDNIMGGYWWSYWDMSTVEIIANVTDNPELLK